MGAVVNLKQNDVYESIMGFINLANFTDNTKANYEVAIRDFFQEVKKKDIEYLIESDLIINKSDVESFRVELKNKGLANTTVNTKVNVVRSLYEHLSYEYEGINTNFFQVVKKLKKDTKQYDFFTVDEVLKLSELASEEKKHGTVKSQFILFAADTSIRKEAILSLKWSDFKVCEDEGTVDIVAFDKGEKDYEVTISLENYYTLLKNKHPGVDQVFYPLTKDIVNKMMPKLIKKLNINDNRRLVFHSLRKTGVQYKYDITKDIRVAQEAANHSDSSINVTVGTYLKKKKNKILGFHSEMTTRKEDVLNNLSDIQLRKLIENVDDIEVIIKLEKLAKEMFQKNNE